MEKGQVFCQENFNHYIYGVVTLQGIVKHVDGPRIELEQVQITTKEGKVIEKPMGIVFL